MARKQVICTECHTIAKYKRQTSSLAMAIVVLVFLFIFWPVALLAALAMLMPKRSQRCRSCRARATIPLDSPRGRELAGRSA